MIISAILIAITVIAISGYLNYRVARNNLENQTLNNLTLLAKTQERYLNQYLMYIYGRTADFSSDGLIRNYFKIIVDGKDGGDASISLIEHLIERKKILNEYIHGINVVDLNGRVIISTSNDEIGKDESGHNYFSVAKNNLKYGQAYIEDVISGHHHGFNLPAIAVSAPLFDIKTKEKIGILINYFYINELKSVFKILRNEDASGVETGKTFEAYLINKDNMMITESRFLDDAVLKQRVDTEPVKRCREKNEGMSGMYPDYRNIPVFGASICLDKGWVLLAEIDEAEVVSGIKDIKTNILYLFLGIITGTSIIVYIISKNIVNPIEKFVEVCRKIAAGDLRQRINIESRDEIGELAKSFNEMAEKLGETDRAKSEFVSLASHQLLTPLTTVSWYVETLLAGSVNGLSEKQKEYIKNVYNTNHNMVETVRALLDVSRIEMGTFYIKPQPVNIAEVVDSVLDELAIRIKEKGLEIIKDFDLSIPIMDMDPQLSRIIFQNLLSNAVKYSPDDKKVIIGTKKREQDILITISDNGYGIPEELQKNVFSKFFRSYNIKEKVPEGTGLGLYIVKSIVDNSGGKIWFESEENKGTTFYVSYPLSGMRAKEGTKQLGV